MKSILMIMNARDIPECISSIKSLAIDKVWFRGYTETELNKVINNFIATTNYDRYILISDDVIATQSALDELLKYIHLDIVTGWCNISPKIHRANIIIDKPKPISIVISTHMLPHFLTNLIKKLSDNKLFRYFYNVMVSKSFSSFEEIYNQPELFRTYFIGWAFTSISRNTWLRYGFYYPKPLDKSTGSDMFLSNRLIDDDIPMYCVRDAFIYHLHSMNNFIVGKVKSEVILDMYNNDTNYTTDYISYLQ